MHNLIQRKVVLTAYWQPLVAEPLIGSVDISCLPGNAGLAFFLGDDGASVPWLPGEWHQVVRVDLSAIHVRGTPGDAITVIGGTW